MWLDSSFSSFSNFAPNLDADSFCHPQPMEWPATSTKNNRFVVIEKKCLFDLKYFFKFKKIKIMTSRPILDEC
jgi:hypothetical protein